MGLPTSRPRGREKNKNRATTNKRTTKPRKSTDKLGLPQDPEGILWHSPATRLRIKRRSLTLLSPIRTPRIFRRINFESYKTIEGKHKDIDQDLKEDMGIAIVTQVDPMKLIHHLFPPSIFPVSIEFVWDKLLEKGEILPPSLLRSRWLRWPSRWGNVRNGETERQLAEFLDSLGEQIAIIIGHSLRRRRWTSKYSSASLKTAKDGELHMNRKPDVIAIIDELFNLATGGEMGWGGVDVVAELKTGLLSLHEFVVSVGKDLADRSYLIFEAQDGRRFIVYLSFVHVKVYISVYDRGATIHTRPLDMLNDSDAKLFLHIFYALTFAPDVYLGYDPTLKKYPNGMRTLTIAGPEYPILGVAWKTLMILGRATICYYVQVDGVIRIAKSSWPVSLREPTEEWFLQRAHDKGVKGVSEMLEYSDVMVNGQVDCTETNRGAYHGKKVVSRTQRRILFKQCALPLWYFASVKELYKVFLSGLQAHHDLVEDADILHRDISLTNLMIERGKVHPRNGLLIDLGYAKLLKKKTTEGSSTKENVRPSSSSRPNNGPEPPEPKTLKVLGLRLENRSDYRIPGNTVYTNSGTTGQNAEGTQTKKKTSGAPKLDSIKEGTQASNSQKAVSRKVEKKTLVPGAANKKSNQSIPHSVGNTVKSSATEMTDQPTGSAHQSESSETGTAESSRRGRSQNTKAIPTIRPKTPVSTTGQNGGSGNQAQDTNSESNPVPPTRGRARSATLTESTTAKTSSTLAPRAKSRLPTAKESSTNAEADNVAESLPANTRRARSRVPTLTVNSVNTETSIAAEAPSSSARKASSSKVPVLSKGTGRETPKVGTSAEPESTTASSSTLPDPSAKSNTGRPVGRPRSHTLKTAAESSTAEAKARKDASRKQTIRDNGTNTVVSKPIVPKDDPNVESNLPAYEQGKESSVTKGGQPVLAMGTEGVEKEGKDAATDPAASLSTNLNTNTDTNKPIRGRRTGTQPFMSLRILADETAEEKPEDDVESFFWVFVYVCTIFTGPKTFLQEKPFFIKDWLSRLDDKSLANNKKGWLGTGPEDFERSLQYITPYFECAKPLIRKLAEAVRFPGAGNLNHKYFIACFDEAFKALGNEDEDVDLEDDDELYLFPGRPEDIIPQPDLVDMSALEERRKLRSLGPINGETVVGIVTADPDVPYEESDAEPAMTTMEDVFGRLAITWE